MHNLRARWLVPFLTASLLVSAAAASTSFAKNGKGGGKKARGEVTSFDATTLALEVALFNGETFEGTVDPDVQVKLEHRGNHSHGNGHGNPSRGSLEDIVAGAQVLRMKFDDEGVVDKIRLRPAAEEPCESAVDEPDGEETETDEPDGEETETDEPDGEETETEPVDEPGCETDPGEEDPVEEPVVEEPIVEEPVVEDDAGEGSGL